MSTSKVLGLWAAVGGESLTPSSALQGTEEPPKFEWETTTTSTSRELLSFLGLTPVISENFTGRLFEEEGAGFVASNM